MRRSSLALVLGAVLAAAGCDDGDSPAKVAAKKRHDEAERALKFVEESADDAKQFPEVMKQCARARALAWGDTALLERVERGAERARAARQTQLDALWNKTHDLAKAALDKSDPAKSEKDCTEALRAIDSLAPAVAARAGKAADEDRKALVERIDAARRANEIIAKAKDLSEESGAKARAFVKSFDLVPSLKTSPFQAQVLALLSTIPDKPASGGAGDAGGGEEIVLFDGTNDAQFTYFDREHDWTWRGPKPGDAEPLIFGDNTETTSDPSTLWVGDDTWGDLVVEVQFNVGDGNLQFHAREKDEQNLDVINLPDAKKGEWASVRIELRGTKGIIRYNGEKSEVTLTQPKGKFGITLTPQAVVKVRSIKLRLLDKDATRPKMHEPKQTDDDDKTDETKKKKKKKKPAAGGEGGDGK